VGVLEQIVTSNELTERINLEMINLGESKTLVVDGSEFERPKIYEISTILTGRGDSGLGLDGSKSDSEVLSTILEILLVLVVIFGSVALSKRHQVRALIFGFSFFVQCLLLVAAY